MWKKLIAKHDKASSESLSVGIVAKYLDNEDTYLSILESLKSAAWHQGVGLDIVWINAETATEQDFDKVDALLVPGGFGARGSEGKIAAATYALSNNKPYLGICLGLQTAVIAAARMGGLSGATSTEFNPKTKNDVVYIMNGQEGKELTGGTQRLGDYFAVLEDGSLAARLYDSLEATERHRHRYEVNKKFIDYINKGGLIVSGSSSDGALVEYVESDKNDYFIATQAHPEFKSRPNRPHPLFVGLLRAAAKA
jgi:CTP synthase